MRPRNPIAPPGAQFWSRHSWLGEVDRFELVKAVRRCRSSHTGARIGENEVGTIVRLLESADARMCDGEFDAAAAALLGCVARSVAPLPAHAGSMMYSARWDPPSAAVDRSSPRSPRSAPSLSIAYYRAALCLSTGGGADAVEAAHLRAGPESAPRDTGERTQQTVCSLLRAAVRTEPDNAALRGNVDLLLRLLRCASATTGPAPGPDPPRPPHTSRVPVPRVYWTAEYPKSRGDVAALAAFVVRKYGGDNG